MAVDLIDQCSLSASQAPCRDVKSKHEWQFALDCKICESPFGWWRLRPRHHCRFCGCSVCGRCSGSYIEVEGQICLQRACNSCTSIIPIAHMLKDRLNRIAGHLGLPDSGFLSRQTSSFTRQTSPPFARQTSPLGLGDVNSSSSFSFMNEGMGRQMSPTSSESFEWSELKLAKQGSTCKLSNVLFMMAATITQEAGSTLVDEIMKVGKTMCGFQENATCSICYSALGKRKLRPRHHCRFCGSSVCGHCSRSSVRVEGWKGTHRACNVCANIIPASHKIKNRLNRAAGRLMGSSESHAQPLDAIDEAIRASQCDLTLLDDPQDNNSNEITTTAQTKGNQSMSDLLTLLDAPNDDTNPTQGSLKKSRSLHAMKEILLMADAQDKADDSSSMKGNLKRRHSLHAMTEIISMSDALDKATKSSPRRSKALPKAEWMNLEFVDEAS